MASISSLLASNLLQQPSKSLKIQSKSSFYQPRVVSVSISRGFSSTPISLSPRETLLRVSAVAEETDVSTQDNSSPSARKLYVGNIPRTVNNEELEKLFAEHGAVEKVEVMYDKYSKRSRRFAFVTMKTSEDVAAAIEKMNESEIGGRQIKVNVTEIPLDTTDSPLQAAESKFIDSPYKVYVGNLAKTVTSDILSKFFSEKGQVLSAKVSTVPGTSKSSGFGFVSFSSDEDVETAISSFNDALLEGQKIRVNKA
ncbi:hypothetical protein MKW98_027872 [Papaver atlanticum]|uniref:Small ribosomal subunit protein cS22 n=1 Tax=Papaver atlanticum TaxID=357466 RepID=A0AAD4SL45_9MAGN|nr:hypothetical protein MKW98_027872 [Papaver atlanticum]